MQKISIKTAGVADPLICNVIVKPGFRTNWIPFDDMPCEMMQILVDESVHERPLAIIVVRFPNVETRDRYLTANATMDDMQFDGSHRSLQ